MFVKGSLPERGNLKKRTQLAALLSRKDGTLSFER
jgi:hypothetical protein